MVYGLSKSSRGLSDSGVCGSAWDSCPGLTNAGTHGMIKLELFIRAPALQGAAGKTWCGGPAQLGLPPPKTPLSRDARICNRPPSLPGAAVLADVGLLAAGEGACRKSSGDKERHQQRRGSRRREEGGAEEGGAEEGGAGEGGAGEGGVGKSLLVLAVTAARKS